MKDLCCSKPNIATIPNVPAVSVMNCPLLGRGWFSLNVHTRNDLNFLRPSEVVLQLFHQLDLNRLDRVIAFSKDAHWETHSSFPSHTGQA